MIQSIRAFFFYTKLKHSSLISISIWFVRIQQRCWFQCNNCPIVKYFQTLSSHFGRLFPNWSKIIDSTWSHIEAEWISFNSTPNLTWLIKKKKKSRHISSDSNATWRSPPRNDVVTFPPSITSLDKDNPINLISFGSWNNDLHFETKFSLLRSVPIEILTQT